MQSGNYKVSALLEGCNGKPIQNSERSGTTTKHSTTPVCYKFDLVSATNEDFILKNKEETVGKEF